jgi:hypothetical protein
MSALLFVYGTLRGDHDAAALEGFEKRADAAYPTIAPADGAVDGQIVSVDDWSEKDRYEGCRPDDPENSLYWRLVSSDGVHIYVGNPEIAERYWGQSWDVDYDYEEAKQAVAEAEVFY